MEEREEHKDKAEEPARVAKEAAQASHEEAQAQSDAAAEEEIREEAEHEYSLIDSDSDGDVTVEEVTTTLSYLVVGVSFIPAFLLARIVCRKRLLSAVFGSCRYYVTWYLPRQRNYLL